MFKKYVDPFQWWSIQTCTHPYLSSCIWSASTSCCRGWVAWYSTESHRSPGRDHHGCGKSTPLVHKNNKDILKPAPYWSIRHLKCINVCGTLLQKTRKFSQCASKLNASTGKQKVKERLCPTKSFLLKSLHRKDLWYAMNHSDFDQL